MYMQSRYYVYWLNISQVYYFFYIYTLFAFALIFMKQFTVNKKISELGVVRGGIRPSHPQGVWFKDRPSKRHTQRLTIKRKHNNQSQHSMTNGRTDRMNGVEVTQEVGGALWRSKGGVLVVSLTWVEEDFEIWDEIERLSGREVPLHRYTVTVTEELHGEREREREREREKERENGCVYALSLE